MRIAIAGGAGRMGRALVEAVLGDGELELAAVLERAGHPALGREAGELVGLPCKVVLSADVAAALAAADVLVDFTRPEGTLAHLEACAGLGKAMVVGTTGFSAAQKARIAEAAKRVALVMAPNMAVGVNVTFKLAETAARTLGDGYDVEIVEAHHRQKVDAPSGTALAAGDAVAAARGLPLKDLAVKTRDGQIGPRVPGTIGFSVIRGGDIVGEHTVLFIAPEERVELVHRAVDRRTFARGALRAARWVAGRAPGLYAMSDVLGLSGTASAR